MKTLRVILTAFVIAGISACGQTGPLYLPNKARPAAPADAAPGNGSPEPMSRQP